MDGYRFISKIQVLSHSKTHCHEKSKVQYIQNSILYVRK